MRTEKTENNAYLESCLAIFLANRPNLFPVVSKISTSILKILTNESLRSKIIERLSEGNNFKAFRDELYVIADHQKKIYKGPLGALLPKKNIEAVTPDEALNDVQYTLESDDTSIINIMPIHSVFGYRILRLLNPEAYQEAAEQFASLKKSLTEIKKFVKRKAEDKDIEVTTQLGVASQNDNFKKINEFEETVLLSNKIPVLEHRNSLSRFMVTPEKFERYASHDAPMAAGDSTHTISLFTAADTYPSITFCEKLTKPELHEYAIAYYSYLCTAGYHTFHEVMSPTAQILGISQDMSSYIANFPKENEALCTMTNSCITRLTSKNKLSEFSSENSHSMDEGDMSPPVTSDSLRRIFHEWDLRSRNVSADNSSSMSIKYNL